jgi:predicted ArsR family transcriptional regulator
MQPNNSERARTAALLADPTRLRLLELIEAANGPLGVAELAAQVGVHHTSVRAHLARLRDGGLIDERTAASAGRGRPKLVYVASAVTRSEPAPSAPEREPYRELSGMLSNAVRTGRSPRQVGRSAGVELAATAHGDDAVGVIEAEAASLGFEPRRATRSRGQVDLVLGHCPFRDVAAADPDTICALHLGIAEGVAESLGGVEVLGMVVKDPYRAGCRLQLRRTEVHA